MPTYAQVRQRLEAVGQSHLLTFYNTLHSHDQDALLKQIDALDLEALPALVETYVKNKPHVALPDDPEAVQPAPYFPFDGKGWDRAAAKAAGEALIRTGKVAAFTVAGGQGSRLGFEGPKGCYPAGAVTGKTLFHIFAENLAGVQERYGVKGGGVPWYIMTSPLNHQPTVAYFEEHSFFGLDKRNVMFFPQGVLPSFDMSGKVLLAGKGEVATNPDGHGGSIRALHVNGALADMKRRGVEQISYFQVDNPIVRAIDPVFLGLHVGAGSPSAHAEGALSPRGGGGSSAEMSSKMIKKAGPDEKVGVFCQVSGKVQVIEYSDLPKAWQEQKLEDGSLRFIAGSIAIHIMSVEFVQRLATDPDFALPYHRAEKKIPHVDLKTGEVVAPQKINGVKLERFVFDALPLCRNSIVYETDRVEEFAPIKNASGVDSVESSKQIQTLRAARWLESAGVKVPRKDGAPDCVLEISARTATSAEELAARRDSLPRSIEPGARVAL
jgi:UDP-N-acetylglucosamine/UDP-N-acetylgalactosamine diphosphorylase